MTVLIAPDSFKDALSALEVCLAIQIGVKRADPLAKTILFPLADGGEGTADILRYHSKGRQINVEVSDPLFRKTRAHYALSESGETAFIEMAQASGLQLLKQEERNCLYTTTLGTGELILDAIRRGAQEIILGIGGSATNDAGMGMASALGFKFLDHQGHVLSPIGENLIMVQKIDNTALHFDPQEITVQVVCDVDNPLFGPNGAAYIYARQKGANDKAIQNLDQGLRHFNRVLIACLQKNVALQAGAGAAGGLGAGALAFLNARLRPGIELVMELTDFEKSIRKADLIITGEGQLDGQTLHGKLIHGITKRAAALNVPVIALCGSLKASPAELHSIGLQAAFSISSGPQSLDEAIKNTTENLRQISFNIIRTLSIFQK